MTAICLPIGPLPLLAPRLSGSAARGRVLQALSGRFSDWKLYPEGWSDEDGSGTPATASSRRTQYYPLKKEGRRVRFVQLIRGEVHLAWLALASLLLAPKSSELHGETTQREPSSRRSYFNADNKTNTSFRMYNTAVYIQLVLHFFTSKPNRTNRRRDCTKSQQHIHRGLPTLTDPPGI